MQFLYTPFIKGKKTKCLYWILNVESPDVPDPMWKSNCQSTGQQNQRALTQNSNAGSLSAML